MAMYNFENIKILIVDDEEILREILVETFALCGAVVDAAENGNEALEKVRQNHYDIVISDIRMPNGDGISLIGNLKKLDKPVPKIFVCSAYNDLTPQKTTDLNILKVFTKPFELEYLLSSVSSFLEK